MSEGDSGDDRVAERKPHFAFSEVPGAALSKTRVVYTRCPIACSKSRKRAFSILQWVLCRPASVSYLPFNVTLPGAGGFFQGAKTRRDAQHLLWNSAGDVCVSGARNGPAGSRPGKVAEGVSRGPRAPGTVLSCPVRLLFAKHRF